MGLFTRKEKETAGSIEWLIVGLGNPGSQYERTRHNCGWLTADKLADKYNVKLKKLKFKSLCGEAVISGKRCLIMKPTTMMNSSGEAVVEAMNFYKIPIENVLVICDDISLDLGKIRVKRKGSDGGQKGLRSIIYLSSKDTFPRVKIGIGAKPNPEYDLAAWVLSRFTDKEFVTMNEAFDKAITGVELIIDGKIDEAMNRLN
ncbi:MAG: aminoacyl-tRNA hydrolase [Oscillospiraceae bacterium]|nr:aminoacyl-tRNA hydrolase [Oscillospiraceae bacterium]